MSGRDETAGWTDPADLEDPDGSGRSGGGSGAPEIELRRGEGQVWTMGGCGKGNGPPGLSLFS